MINLTYSIADQNVATTKSIGIYNFSVHLFRHLHERAEIRALTVFSNRTLSPSLLTSANVRVEERNEAIESKLGRIRWDQWGVYRHAAATGNPWLFLPKGFSSFVVRPRMRVAAYVHDIMGDFYRRRYPGFWSRFESEYFARSLQATIRRARVIFTNTNFTRSELIDLARRKGLAEPNVVVAGYGFEPPAIAQRQKRNSILLFASNMPHKRTDIAIRFLDHWLRESHYDGTIDCIGILSSEMEKPEGRSWNWIGRVPPAEGRDMIRAARAVIYVSEYEGFGMPPVEAALEGTCPVFSDLPPIREVMGNAGFAFSNESQASFSQALDMALATSEETIREWADSLLSRHNWPAVTQKIISQLSVD